MKCFTSPFQRNHKVTQLECNWPQVRILKADLNCVIKTPPEAENTQQNNGWKIFQALVRGMRFTGAIAYYLPKQEVLLCRSNMKIIISEEAERCLHSTRDRSKNIKHISCVVTDVFQSIREAWYNIKQTLHKRGRSEYFVKEHKSLTAFSFGVLFASNVDLKLSRSQLILLNNFFTIFEVNRVKVLEAFARVQKVLNAFLALCEE